MCGERRRAESRRRRYCSAGLRRRRRGGGCAAVERALGAVTGEAAPEVYSARARGGGASIEGPRIRWWSFAIEEGGDFVGCAGKKRYRWSRAYGAPSWGCASWTSRPCTLRRSLRPCSRIMGRTCSRSRCRVWETHCAGWSPSTARSRWCGRRSRATSAPSPWISVRREANPDVVVVRVSGYGQTGPYREKAGFGTPATGFSGFAYITGYPDRPPVLPQVSLADYVTGMFGALGAMTALYHRDALGGEAQEVDVALYESMFRMLETVVTQYDRLGVVRERTGNELGASVPAGIFSSKDGKWMVLTTSTDRTFRRLAKLMGRSDMVDDPRYSTNRARVRRREEVHGVVADWFASLPAEEIQRLCDENGVPVSVAYNAADIFEDPQYAARDMLVEVEHPTFGSITVPGVVPKFSKTEGSVRGVGPTLGQHNAEVYEGLGLSEDDIEGLREEGVI